MDNKYKKLVKCVLLDAVGIASAVVPVVGPVLDVIWAPVAASISYKMFGEKKGKYTSLVTFVEELLPVTDVIPSFTIFWILFDLLGIGKEKESFRNVTEAEFVEVK